MRPRAAARTAARLVTAVALVLVSLLLPASGAHAAVDATLQITKAASAPGPFTPGQVRVGQDDAELVAAQAGHEVVIPEGGLDRL